MADASAVSASCAVKSGRWVDSHLHIWDATKQPFAEGKDPPESLRNSTAEDLISRMDAAGVDDEGDPNGDDDGYYEGDDDPTRDLYDDFAGGI